MQFLIAAIHPCGALRLAGCGHGACAQGRCVGVPAQGLSCGPHCVLCTCWLLRAWHMCSEHVSWRSASAVHAARSLTGSIPCWQPSSVFCASCWHLSNSRWTSIRLLGLLFGLILLHPFCLVPVIIVLELRLCLRTLQRETAAQDAVAQSTTSGCFGCVHQQT